MISAGCINTDPAVFVDASIQSPSAAVQASSLVNGLSGGFGLRLHLSARASDTATVAVTAFSVLAADSVTTVHSPLSYQANVALPVQVAQDSTVEVAVSFSADENQLPANALDALCAAGGIHFKGVLEDSLRGGSFTVPTAQAIAVSGCP